MAKKFKVTLAVFLVVVLGCFSQALAASSQNMKLKKSVESSRNVKLFGNIATTNYVPNKDYSPNLIADYKLDETSGTVCKDSSGNGNDGTYKGTTSITDGYGIYRSFNGTSDSIKFNKAIIPKGKKSIKFKIKMNGKPNAEYYEILGNTTTSFNNYGDLVYIRKQDSTMRWVNFCGDGITARYDMYVDVSRYLFDNNWHVVLLTWDGTVNENCVKMYIDDLIVPKYATKAKSQEESNVVRSSDFCIGTDPSTSTQNFCGGLKDIEIYSDVLNYNIKDEELTLSKYTDSLNIK